MAGEEIYLRILLAVLAVSISSQASYDQEPGLTLYSDAPRVIAQRASPLLLNCTLPAGLQLRNLEYQWMKNGNPINLGRSRPKQLSGRIQMKENGSLYFRRVQHRTSRKKRRRSDEGMYDCHVRTHQGSFIGRRVHVQVASIAKNFSQEPENFEAVEGGVARFQCSISAVPSPLIMWQHHQSNLSLDRPSKYSFQPMGVLHINNVTRADAGEYRCLALQNLPDVVELDVKHSRSAFLTVRSAELSRPTRVLAVPHNLTLEVGTSGHMECLADGSPAPSVTWTKSSPSTGGQVLSEPLSVQGGLLTFSEVKPMDAGVYMCTIKGFGANPLYFFATLAVLEPPKITGETPKFQAWPVMRIVRFSCGVSGVPSPRYTWLHNGQPFTSKMQRVQIDQENDRQSDRLSGRLIIRNVEMSDRGFYQCIAENEVGMVNLLGKLEVYQKQGAPLAPTNLTGQALSTTTILLSWDQPSNFSKLDLITTIIYYSKNGESAVPKFKDRGDGNNSDVLENLVPNTNYTIYVRTFNTEGASDKSNVVIICTWEELGPVRDLQVHPLNATAVQLSWAIGPGQKLPVTYNLVLMPDIRGSSVLRSHSVQYPQTEAVFAGLENTTSYVARVVARTGGEDSPPAEVTFTTSSLPPPGGVAAFTLSSTTIRLSWEAVKSPLQPALYQVCYTSTDTTAAPTTQQCLNSTETEVEVGRLAPHTTYSFTVVVHARSLCSPPSHPVDAITAPDVPGAPGGLTGSVTSPGVVELQWSRPLTPNGVITGYIVSLHQNGQEPLSVWRNISVEGEVTAKEVTELTGPVYYFVVYAVSSVGVGTPTPVLQVKLLACPEADPKCGDPAHNEPKHGSVTGTERRTGIIVGAVISLVFILVCILIIVYIRKKGGCSRRMPQSFHGNGHAVGAGSGNGHVTGGEGGSRSAIPLQDLESLAPMLTQLPENEHSDAKGGGHMIVTPNGVRVNGLLRNFQNGQIANGHIVHYPDGRPMYAPEETQRLIDTMLASTDGSFLMEGNTPTSAAPRPALSHLDSLDEIDHDPDDPEEEDRAVLEEEEQGRTARMGDRGARWSGPGRRSPHSFRSPLPVEQPRLTQSEIPHQGGAQSTSAPMHSPTRKPEGESAPSQQDVPPASTSNFSPDGALHMSQGSQEQTGCQTAGAPFSNSYAKDFMGGAKPSVGRACSQVGGATDSEGVAPASVGVATASVGGVGEGSGRELDCVGGGGAGMDSSTGRAGGSGTGDSVDETPAQVRPQGSTATSTSSPSTFDLSPRRPKSPQLQSASKTLSSVSSSQQAASPPSLQCQPPDREGRDGEQQGEQPSSQILPQALVANGSQVVMTVQGNSAAIV